MENKYRIVQIGKEKFIVEKEVDFIEYYYSENIILNFFQHHGLIEKEMRSEFKWIKFNGSEFSIIGKPKIYNTKIEAKKEIDDFLFKEKITYYSGKNNKDGE